METNRITELLGKNDKLLLSAVSKENKYLSKISEESGIDKSALLNSARKLLNYGLLKIINEVSIEYRLTGLGRKYLSDGLPEYLLAKKIKGAPQFSYRDVKKLPLDADEVSAALGILRKNKIIQVNADNFLLDESKVGLLERKNALLKRVDTEKTAKDDEDTKDLLRRGIIEKSEIVSEKIEITDVGSNAVKSSGFNKDLVDRLTPEAIKDWKGAEFREYSLDTEPAQPLSGRRNVSKQFSSHVKDVLVAMGFEEMQSDYAESSFWNFDVMMFKQDHPDRDIQDTVYINAPGPKVPKELLDKVSSIYKSGFALDKNNNSVGYKRDFDESKSKVLIMRGHTTATTFRYIHDNISKNKDTPAKYFSISKVFRNETSDATHLPEFYQVEGIVYDDDLNLADLIGYITEFYKKIGIDKIRLKPTYNPYTEPSLEIQAFSPKLKRWIEVGNSGVFRPETLEPFGIKKNIVAWGFGFDRMLILRLGIADIRSIYGGFADLDFLRTVESKKLFGKFN